MDLNGDSSSNQNMLPGSNPASGLFNLSGFDDSVQKDPQQLAVDSNSADSNLGHSLQVGEINAMSDISQVLMQQENSQENLPESSKEEQGNTSKAKCGWPKGRKRRRQIRDVNAPKAPITGYVRFLQERRMKVRSENPDMTFSELTKKLGKEWTDLSPLDKQKYLAEAEKDKERYAKELEQYQQTETYKAFAKKQEERKRKAEAVGDSDSQADVIGAHDHQVGEDGRIDNDIPGIDIPIFTEEFLNFNRARENELRQLRKSTTEYEEQNAILQKHIDNMKAAMQKLESEAVQQRNTNTTIQQHLQQLRQQLTTNFAGVPLPGTNEVPSLNTIDSYMTKLHQMILDSPQENENLISSVREIVGKMDL